jgi:hypothetical protein
MFALLYSLLVETLYILTFKYRRPIYMWLYSRMNNHSDLSDTNGAVESHVALHRRCTDSNASTVLSATSGTTIYSVTLDRPANVA